MLSMLPSALRSSVRLGRTVLAAVALIALTAGPAAAQVVFDTFDDGDVSDVFVFSETNAGVGVGPTDGQGGADNTALSAGADPAQYGAFAGFVIPGGDGVTDVSGTNTLSFYLRPTTVVAGNLPLTLEINLHEDVDGNGTYEGASEDEFQATVPVTVGSGYTLVTIPLTGFQDDNTAFPGANDGFDFTKLLEIVVAFGANSGPEFTFAMDEVIFTTEGPPTGPITEFEYFNDGEAGIAARVFTFSESNGGIGVGPTADATNTPDRALNVGIDPAGTGSFAGFVLTGGDGVTDISDAVSINFQFRPTIEAGNLPLTLEINLHEDVDGNGTYEGASEDEFQATYAVTASSDEFINVSIPISAFTDDNSVFVGANDGFDFSKLLEVVFAIGGPTGPGYSLSFDQFFFEGGTVAVGEVPEVFSAAPVAFPNPTAGAATVAFELASASDIAVDVFDLLGRRVARVAEGPQAAGAVRLAVPTGDFAPGVYVVRVQTGAGVAATRLTVLR